jgi:hypothetical protein
MESAPTGNVEVVNVAVLETQVAHAVRVAVPICVLPFMKTTEPVAGRYNPTGEVGVPSGALAPSSVAVSVTACPNGAVGSELLTVAVGVSGVTVIVTGSEVEGP